MANEKFTQLPAVTSAQLTDVICAVQTGVSVQETLSQVSNLMLSNTILNFSGNPNGNVAGRVYQLCWDTANNLLYVCTTTGNTSTAVWTVVSSLVGPTISVNVPSTSGVPIVNNVATDLTSILITPGKWSISGNIFFAASASTMGAALVWINTVSASAPDGSYFSGIEDSSITSHFNLLGFNAPSQIMTVVVNTNIYLTGLISLDSGTCNMSGNLIAQQIG